MADKSESRGEGESAPDQNHAVDTSAEKSDEEILKEAHARFKLCEEAEADIRRDALDDLKFRAGDQWDAAIKAERNQDSRPCLTINRLPQHMQQVTNDQRQNRPSIKIHPVDDGADVETAKIRQGLIRHIEANSSADFAYDTAFEGTVGEGLGYFRIRTEYCDPLSFDQDIKIDRIRDRFSVFFDPYSQKPDGSDAKFGFIVDNLSPDEYRMQYPDSKLAATGEWESYGTRTPEWVKSGSARIAEYYYKDFRTAEIVQLSGGQVVEKAKLQEFAAKAAMQTGVSPDLTVVKERKAQIPTIKWCKITGAEVLEKADIPGIFIPIIPVYGTEHVIDGKRILKGIVRDAKDSQRVYNVMKSAEMEAIGLAPKAPFIVEEHQLEGYENEWKQANRKNYPYLKYKAYSANGTNLPPPQRMAFEPAVMAITQAAMGASEDIKSTTGIYDATLGGRSNETSGKAILARNNQAQTSNFHFIDNLTRSLKHAGRIINDWIPVIYDTERTARILGEDNEPRVVKLNAPFEEKGKMVTYRMDVGKYDVTVDVGPSYASKRQEAAQSMLELSKVSPQIMGVAGDLMVKSMDWPGSQEIADRLKKTLPPELQEDPNQGKQPVPPQVQAQMQQSQMMIEQLTSKLNEAQDQIQQKRIELESKERIEMAKIRADLEIAMLKVGSQESLTLLQAQIGQIEQRMQLLNVDRPIEDVTQDEQPPQDMAMPEPDGAPYDGAEFGDGGLDPTGGGMPGQPLEGNQNVDPSLFNP